MIPDLTIIMPTWNKEAYIREALDSVFAQVTDYRYRLLVADDCSTDRSLEIVAEYERAHPGVIEVLPSERNQKLFLNVLRAYRRLDTRYFCVLDPDDWWADPAKIQRSLDYLESHHECSIYVTDTWIERPGAPRERLAGRDTPYDCTFADYLSGRAVCGCSLGSMFRNTVFVHGVPAKLEALVGEDRRSTAYRGDAFRTVLHLSTGTAHYEPVCDAVYRVTDEGLWQGSPQLRRELLNVFFMVEMHGYFDARHPGFLRLAAERLRRVDARWAELVAGETAESLSQSLALYRELRAALPPREILRAPAGLQERLYSWLYSRSRRKLRRLGILEDLK